MEYDSPIWGGSTHVLSLDRVQRRVCRLVDAPVPQSLQYRRRVASLSLFYRYYNGCCSTELANCLPPPLRRVCRTRQAVGAHAFAVHLSNPRLELRRNTFFCAVAPVWNELPFHVFPLTYDMGAFKRAVAGLPRP